MPRAFSSGIDGEPLEKIRAIAKRYAAIPLAVLVPAHEVLGSVTEQNRSCRHELAPRVGAALKTPGHDDRDTKLRVLFLEGTISRTGGADDVLDGPTVARGEHASCQTAGRAVRSAFRQSPSQIDSNFCQELISPLVL